MQILIHIGIVAFFSVLMPNWGYSLEESTFLRTLKKDHPRIIVISEDIPRIKNLIQNDEVAAWLYQELKQDADKILGEKPVEYIIVGPRLLSQSRLCLDRIYTLGLVYHLDRNPNYLERAVKELRAAAAFPDWNPSHFLDTAEMAHAFAIAYDWLFTDLELEDKSLIRNALIEKGLNAYLSGIEKNAWWIDSQHNWNQVCHGGIGIGALAIADENPELATSILTLAIEKMPLALQHYAPDGGWNEGPGYWHYATRYTVYFLAALQTALGTDFGLSDYPGLDNAGQFRIDFEGPTGLSFNYADAGSRVGDTHEMFWLSKRYNRPVYAWMERQDLRSLHALDLIWYSSAGNDPQQCGIPLDAYYKGIDVAFFRSAWNDPQALFIGFKGGDNKANHSHLDLGSFVLDALGKRWAIDLGADDYNLPGYFGNQRWMYYRLINQSHNTIVIDGENQNPKAKAPILHFQSSPDKAFAIADLSEAYSVKKLHRGIALINRRHVIVQDEMESDQPVQFDWGIITPADIEIKNHIARLKIDDARLFVKIVMPDDAHFEVVSANPPKPQRQNEKMKRLSIRLEKPVDSLRLMVQFTPYTTDHENQIETLPVHTLNSWPNH